MPSILSAAAVSISRIKLHSNASFVAEAAYRNERIKVATRSEVVAISVRTVVDLYVWLIISLCVCVFVFTSFEMKQKKKTLSLCAWGLLRPPKTHEQKIPCF